MDEVEVYFSDDSELAEFEAIQKGYRIDVYVKIKANYYNVKIYDMIRLKQDFNDEVESEGYYLIEPNLILVKEVNREEIKFSVYKLFKQNYFDNVKPLEKINFAELKKV